MKHLTYYSKCVLKSLGMKHLIYYSRYVVASVISKVYIAYLYITNTPYDAKKQNKETL